MQRKRRTRKPVDTNVKNKSKTKKEIKDPSLKVFYKDIDELTVEDILKIEHYADALSYKENFEDAVSNIIEDGGIWIGEGQVVPIHRVLRFDAMPETKPRANQSTKPRANQSTKPSTNQSTKPSANQSAKPKLNNSNKSEESKESK